MAGHGLPRWVVPVQNPRIDPRRKRIAGDSRAVKNQTSESLFCSHESDDLKRFLGHRSLSFSDPK